MSQSQALVPEDNERAIRNDLRWLLRGVSPDILSAPDINLSPLMVAVACDRPGEVAALLDAGVDPTGWDESLACSVFVGLRSVQVGRMLVDAGADLNAICYKQFVPLDLYARHGEQQLVEMLLAVGAEVPRHMRTPEYWASLGARGQPCERVLNAHLLAANLQCAMGERDGGAPNRATGMSL